MVGVLIRTGERERVSWLSALAVGTFAGLAGLAGSYALVGSTPAFFGARVAAFVVATAPPALVAFSIQTLGLLGDLLAFLFALALAAALLGAGAFVGVLVAGRWNVPLLGTVVAGVVAWLVAFAVGGAAVGALAAALPVAAVTAVWEVSAGRRAVTATSGRRALLRTVGAALGFAGVGYLLGSRRPSGAGGALPPVVHAGEPASNATGGEPMPDMASIEELLAEAAEKSLDVEGLPGLVSPIEEFYEVDINRIDPDVDAGDWRLRITGRVENPRTLTYDDVVSMPRVNRFKTLRCVGEGLNARLMDNAVWTGVPIMDIIDGANPQSDCNCVMLRAEDGYFEQFPLAALRTGFLAYGMNGRALPRNHGYPVRALVPGHWGEINVKWLAEIELLRVEEQGFWERRGWHGTGPVTTVAKLWTTNRLGGGRYQVGGLAYAGTRGVERVEVSTDGGETWTDAELSEPLSGEDVWRQWVHEWTPSPGSHEVVVRATDGTGALQPRAEARPFPNGASGWVSETISV